LPDFKNKMSVTLLQTFYFFLLIFRRGDLKTIYNNSVITF